MSLILSRDVVQKLFFSFILLGGPQCVTAQVHHKVEFSLQYESPVYLRSGSITLTDADMDAALERIPEADRPGVLMELGRVGGLSENVLLHHLWANELMTDESVFRSVDVQALLYDSSVRLASQLARAQFIQEVELDDYTGLARELYLSEPELFQSEPIVDFEQALIPMPEGSVEAVGMGLIVELHDQLSDGDPIVELPIEFDNRGMDISFDQFDEVLLSKTIEPVSAQLMALEEGAISQPFRSGFGWHIVRLLKRHPSHTLSWDQAKPMANQLARQRYLTKQLENKKRELQDRPVQFGENAVKSLQDRHGATLLIEEMSATPQN